MSLLQASYVTLFAFWGLSNFIEIPIPLNLVVTSTMIVYIGSHRSLNLTVKDEDEAKKGKDGSVEGKDSAAEKPKGEMMSASDVAQFPITGSCALFGLFCAFKFLDKSWVNFIISLYFSLIGCFTLMGTFAPVTGRIFGIKDEEKKWLFKTPKLPPVFDEEIDMRLTTAELISLVPSSVFAYFYFNHKHFMLNNVLGISFCVQMIERVSIGSYRNGLVLLVGLFFYDIFWVFFSESVFGSNVMVSVAKNLDGPIKLLFPRVLPSTNSTVLSEAFAATLRNAGNSSLVNPKDIGQMASNCNVILNSITQTITSPEFTSAAAASLLIAAGTQALDSAKQQLSALNPSSKGSSIFACIKKVITGGNVSLPAIKGCFYEPPTPASEVQTKCTRVMSSITRPLDNAIKGEYSLLGLGDIVIPGMFVAILLRFDAKLANVKGKTPELENFPKWFFFSNIILYALGLVCTVGVMYFFNAAQPALLYLVPACILASLGMSAVRGKFGELYKYNEEEEPGKDAASSGKEKSQ